MILYCPNLKIGFLELDIYTDALKNNVSFIPSGTDSNAILTDKDNKIIFKNENISKDSICDGGNCICINCFAIDIAYIYSSCFYAVYPL